MSSAAAFRIGARLSLATTVLLFGLIVLGSVVRTTGSGLASPDWPLCQGRLIPPFEFNVLIEWFHRLAALLTSVSLFVTVGWVLVHPATRARVGLLAALAVVLLLVQVLLGALTVWKLLSPSVVSSHLAVALLLFVTMLALTLGARAESAPDAPRGAERPAGLLAAFGITAALAYAQSLLGGIVSTSHAGLACPDWPLCDGRCSRRSGASKGSRCCTATARTRSRWRCSWWRSARASHPTRLCARADRWPSASRSPRSCSACGTC